MRQALLGRWLTKPRLVGGAALQWEVSGARDRLHVDVDRRCAGLYLLTRDEWSCFARLSRGEPSGAQRHALLSFRRHLDGVRVTALESIPGDRHLYLACGGVLLALRAWGTPAATLVLQESQRVLATFGGGRAAWPLPDARTDAIEPRGAPRLILPRQISELRDQDLVPAGSVRVAAGDLEVESGVSFAKASWRAALAEALLLATRGQRFAERKKQESSEAKVALKRLSALERHLESDQRSLVDPKELRRAAEAILANPSAVVPAERVELVDPYDSSRTITARLDPQKSALANAEALFEKARRMERAREQIAERLASVARERAAAALRLEAADSATQLSDLSEGSPLRGAPARPDTPGAGPRHYLTTRGLSLLVGRGAKENHELTFGLARPEDLWLHAREVPGAHVILRDGEGRANAQDEREAAEVAAFFSDAKEAKSVDVHVARRKHLRAVRGSVGRVAVSHSETVRVPPRDPEGRLRRRP